MKPQVERDWTTKAGLRAVARSNGLPGSRFFPTRHWLCGYVEVPRGHAMYGDDSDAGGSIKAHGGITHSGPGSDGIPVESDGWWFGFACDWPHFGGAPKDVPYVVAECEALAEQLAKLSPAV